MTYKLPEGWKEVKLGEVSGENSGMYGINESSIEYNPDFYRYLRITDIKDDGTIDESKKVSVGIKKGADSKYLLNKNDIVLARTGASAGRNYFYKGEEDPMIFAGFLIKFALDESKVNPEYIKYYCQSKEYKDWVKSVSTGSTRPNINAKMYSNMVITLPPSEQQELLVNTLSSLDNKIELNNKINENLEEQAQAIFKHWFVDFEFPDENSNPYKSSGGEMVESELGMIPKGWEVGEINKYFDIGIGRTPPRKRTYYFSGKKEDMIWVSIADLGKSGMFISESKEKLTDQAFEDFNIRIIPENTVLMSFKLTIGRLAITDKKLTTNEAIAHFINKEFDMTQYLYLYLKVFEFEKLGNTSSIGTAINSTIVKKMPFLKPDKKILDYLNNVLNPIFSNIKVLQIQNQKLSELRDTLLPKLMSGELRIPINSKPEN